MSSRWKKVWADFWVNKTRTFLTIITIMVGTFAVGFNINMSLFMNESMESDFLSASPSEATVSAYPLDEVSVKIAAGVPGVDAVEGRSITSAQVIHTDGSSISIVFTALAYRHWEINKSWWTLPLQVLDTSLAIRFPSSSLMENCVQ
jgi:hypothetical protein